MHGEGFVRLRGMGSRETGFSYFLTPSGAIAIEEEQAPSQDYGCDRGADIMLGQGGRNLIDSARDQNGSDVVIFRNKGTPLEKQIISRMVRNTEKEGERRKYFSFPEGTDIQSGDVVQIKAARDFWSITDAEDHVIGDVVVQVKAFYEKMRPLEPHKPAPIPLEIGHLHSEVVRVASSLVASGHYRQAITDTFIGLDKYVESKSGIKDSGASLMGKVFSADAPVLELSKEKEEQKGFMMLFMGAMKAIRNQYAHSLVDPKNKEEALEWLGFASALFRLADSAQKKP